MTTKNKLLQKIIPSKRYKYFNCLLLSKKMISDIFAFLCGLGLLLLLHINVGRGPLVETSQIITEPKKNFRLFNPCSCRILDKRIDVFRYSNRHICPTQIWPNIFYDEKISTQTSYVVIGIKEGTGYSVRFLDSSAFGFGHFEDGRVIKINDEHIVIVFTKYVKERARICVALVRIDSQNIATNVFTQEFHCETQNQKNWIPRLQDGHLLLYASIENQIKFVVPNILSKTGHLKMNVSPIKLFGQWRGSSPIQETKLGSMGLVHYRRKPSLKKKLFADYVHAFYLLKQDSNTKKDTFVVSNVFEFQVKQFPGFIYVSGFEVLGDVVQISAGITDCYAIKFNLPWTTVSDSFAKKKNAIEKINVEPLEMY